MQVCEHVSAPRQAIYRALLDPEAIRQWRVPAGMTSQVLEFETDDPALRGTMTVTTTLTDAAGGTDILVVYDGIPDAVPAADSETGTRISLANLAKLVE